MWLSCVLCLNISLPYKSFFLTQAHVQIKLIWELNYDERDLTLLMFEWCVWRQDFSINHIRLLLYIHTRISLNNLVLCISKRLCFYQTYTLVIRSVKVDDDIVIVVRIRFDVDRFRFWNSVFVEKWLRKIYVTRYFL